MNDRSATKGDACQSKKLKSVPCVSLSLPRFKNEAQAFAKDMAQYSDTEMESLFLRKYLTSQLQIFRYKSEITKPSRKLRSERASRRGPMIVCVDSSASMYGVPQRIEASLLSKLEQTAEQLNRDCFLIDFSVDVRPIELRSRRKKRAMERIGMKSEDNENFQGAAKDSFKSIQKKTSNQAYLSFHKLYGEYPRPLRKILENYDFQAPFTGHLSNYNNYLHLLCKYIGFDEEI